MNKDKKKCIVGCCFQSLIGIAEIAVAIMMIVAGLGVLSRFAPSVLRFTDLHWYSFYLALIIYVGLFLLFIRPRLKDKLQAYRYPRGEFAINVVYAVLVILGLFYLNRYLIVTGVNFDLAFLVLPMLLLTCIFLMLQGFISKVDRLIVYSQFWLLILIIWLAQVMEYYELYYVIIPFGLVVFTIGLVNFISFIRANPVIRS